MVLQVGKRWEKEGSVLFDRFDQGQTLTLVLVSKDVCWFGLRIGLGLGEGVGWTSCVWTWNFLGLILGPVWFVDYNKDQLLHISCQVLIV